MKLRCSSLPLVSLCAQAQHAPVVRIAGDDKAANLGSATHETLAKLIATGLPATHADIAAAADDWDVDVHEAHKLYAMGGRLWETVRQWFPAPQTEVALPPVERDGITLTGHADVLDEVDDEGRGADHKTGFLDYDSEQQMRGYAMLHLSIRPALNRWWGVVLRVRDGERVMYRWTRDEMERWWAKLVDHLRADEYRPGPHCRFCPRWHECPAGKAYVRQLGEMFIADAGGALQLTPLRAIDIMERVKLIETFCERMRDAIKLAVISEGGEWSDADGNTLRLKQEERREILYAAGAAILAELGDRFPEAIKVSKTKAEEIVKANAPRGMKSLAVQRMMDRLFEAGAVKINTIEKLVYTPASKQIGVRDE